MYKGRYVIYVYKCRNVCVFVYVCMCVCPVFAMFSKYRHICMYVCMYVCMHMCA